MKKKEDQREEIKQGDLPDNMPIINALLAEYQSIHSRVSKQISQYDETNVKILMLVGVLLWFGISYFDNVSYPSFPQFVDIVFFIALPIIAISSIILSIADLVKVMILGDYLKVIEDKINKVLKNQAASLGFSRGKVMDWEYWRIKHGHVKGPEALSEISFSFIIVFLICITALLSSLIRLHYLQNHEAFLNEYNICLISMIVFASLFSITLILSVAIYIKRRKKTVKTIEIDFLQYQ